jgi:hypothetical protein
MRQSCRRRTASEFKRCRQANELCGELCSFGRAGFEYPHLLDLIPENLVIYFSALAYAYGRSRPIFMPKAVVGLCHSGERNLVAKTLQAS